MAPKVRKVDLNPDEFLVGLAGLTPAEAGVYVVSLLLQYSSGGSIPWDDERLLRLLKARKTHILKIMAKLVACGKLQAEGTRVVKNRVRNELETATKRIQSASENASKRWSTQDGIEENQQDTNAGAFSPALLTTTTTTTNKTNKGFEEGGDKGNSGPASRESQGPKREWSLDERRNFAHRKVAEALGNPEAWELIGKAADGDIAAKRICKRIAREIGVRWYDGKSQVGRAR